MLNRESLFRGDAALTARQRQTIVFVGGTVAVVAAIALSFAGPISGLIHRNDPLAMQAVSGEGTDTTGAADGSADASFDRIVAAPEAGGSESGAAAPDGTGTSTPAAGSGRFTGTYKPSKAAAPSPLAPTATTAAPAGDPGSTTPTTQAPAITSTTPEPSSTTTTAATSSSTTTTRPPATTTTTTKVTVTEATVPPTVLTTPTTRPPTTAEPTTAPPPPSSVVIPGPVA